VTPLTLAGGAADLPPQLLDAFRKQSFTIKPDGSVHFTSAVTARDSAALLLLIQSLK
jgi:hypothetical protein